MESILQTLTEYVAFCLNVVAVLLVAFGALETLFGIGVLTFDRQRTEADRRKLYIRFAHWLVAALTFQLGADIVETTVAPSWQEIGQVAAIAVIRTFLTYFLDRDLDKALEERQAEQRAKQV